MDKPGTPDEQSIREHTIRLVEVANSLNLSLAENTVDAQFHRTTEFSDLVQRGLESLDHLYRASILGSGPREDYPWDQPTATHRFEPLLAMKQVIVPVSYREMTDKKGPEGEDGRRSRRSHKSRG